jgi:hypothetical protein
MPPILLLAALSGSPAAAPAPAQKPPTAQQPVQPQQPQQPPSLPPAPADAPRGLAPALGYAVSDGKRISVVVAYPVPRQEVRDVRTRTATGQEQVQKQTVTVMAMEFGLQEVPEKTVRITTTDGKAVTYADAATQVKGGKVVALVFLFEDKRPDPVYLKALREDVLIFEVQPEAPPGGQPAAVPPPKK